MMPARNFCAGEERSKTLPNLLRLEQQINRQRLRLNREKTTMKKQTQRHRQQRTRRRLGAKVWIIGVTKNHPR